MYFSILYDFNLAKEYCKQVGLQIERGKAKLILGLDLQEDIEMVVKNGKHRIVGFVDLGGIHDDMETLAGMHNIHFKIKTYR